MSQPPPNLRPAGQNPSQPRSAAQATLDYYQAILGARSAMPRTVMPDSEAFAILSGIGVEVVLEDIARGYMVPEIATAYGVPQLAFRRWVALAIKAEHLRDAVSSCADAFVARAMALLSLNHKTSDERQSMTALAKQLVAAAACMSPDNWMPNRISGGGDAMAPPVVVNVFQPPPRPANQLQVNQFSGTLPPGTAFAVPAFGQPVAPPSPPPGSIPMSALTGGRGPATGATSGTVPMLPPTAANSRPGS